MDSKLLGQRIKEARLAKKMTQSEVVGSFITRNMLSQIESGNAVPSMKTLTYLAQVLELPPAVLLQGMTDHDTDDADVTSGHGGAPATPAVPEEVIVFYRAKEAYLADNDTDAYELLASAAETSPLFDETQALFARVTLRLATTRCSEERFSEALELATAAATAASKGLYASPELKSQAFLLLSEAAANLAKETQ